MMGQEQAWIITLVLMAAVIAPFLIIAKKASGEQDYAEVQQKTARIRTYFFWGLIVVFSPVIAWSLGDLPYGAGTQSGTAPVTVKAVGYQWYWEMDRDTVPAGTPVEFHVSSADVNHGFALYDAEMQVVAQTQAMPGYTNVLRHTFEKPGVYKVFCLEYCGLAHHSMVTEIKVTGASANAEGVES